MPVTKDPYKDGAFQREMRMILLTGIWICGFTIFFLLQKQYFDQQELPLHEQFRKEEDQLKSLRLEAHDLVSSNPICQFYNHKELNREAISCLTNRMRPDTVGPLFELLTYKGYKISSAWWLSQRYLNQNLITRMVKNLDDQVFQMGKLINAHSNWVAIQMYHEAKKVSHINLISSGLLLWVIIIFPVRWGWYLWKSKLPPLEHLEQFIAQVVSR